MSLVVPDSAAAQRAVSVGVLFPNYNHGVHISRALTALVEQSHPADEIIVVDDASTDNSLDIIGSFQAQLPQLRIIRHSHNLGVTASINRALAEAQSSYVVCSAADDWMRPHFIERMRSVVQRFPGLPLYVSQCVRYFAETEHIHEFGPESELGCWYVGSEAASVSPQQLCALLDRRFVWLPITGAFVDRDALRNLGGFDPALRWHSDWFVTYALALRSGFAVLPEPHAIFRVARESYSGIGMRDPKQQRAVCLAIYEKLSRPENADIFELLRAHPAPFSPFMRNMLLGLARQPADWPFLANLLRWWGNEVMHGRRPGFLRDVVDRWRGTTEHRLTR